MIDFAARIADAMGRVLDEHAGERIVIVAHGGVVWASAKAFLNLPFPMPAFLKVDNTSITEWSFGDDPSQLMRYNDFAHLQLIDG